MPYKSVQLGCYGNMDTDWVAYLPGTQAPSQSMNQTPQNFISCQGKKYLGLHICPPTCIHSTVLIGHMEGFTYTFKMPSVVLKSPPHPFLPCLYYNMFLY